ncbi:hypothetical protein BJX61DRAFT_316429 [Aspergillus egyptiacus]|nr:hypothetical protein BJX61DRAFT_316429 [Aspergillus egyptiacus]
MSGFKGIMKDGWHPKGREGKRESWRNDFKGVNQAGWMGKGKDKDEEREQHVSRPLSSLKDPASFAPPPKHIKYHGPAALPNEITPDRSGVGAPLSQAQINQQNARRQREEEEEEEEKRAAEEAAKRPPVPYRANRTGIDPSTLPPPPVRRIGSAAAQAPISASPKPAPSLPPRLPPRTNTSTSISHSPSPPPVYSPSPPATENPQAADGYINQAATSRLSQAGVSVPALGIGARTSNPTTPPAAGYTGQAPVNELQNRFSQLRTNSSPATPPVRSPPIRQTESSSPASSTASARSALNDFRSKHSDRIDAGKQKLQGFNQKYGIGERLNNVMDSKSDSANQAPPIPPHPSLSRSTTSSSTDTEGLARRKAPPPPPPQKKTELRSTPVNTTGSPVPPPLPLDTKPR